LNGAVQMPVVSIDTRRFSGMLCHACIVQVAAVPYSTFLETAMKSLFLSVALGAGFLLSAGAYADAPAGAIAQCKDGTYFTGTTHKGACKGHDGVKEWLDKTATTPAATPAAPAAASTASTDTSSKTKSGKASSTAATSSGAAPAGAIAKCKDGTYFSGTSHNGACRGHQGVADWLDGGAAASTSTPAAPATPAVAPAPAPAPKVAPVPATPAASATPATKSTTPTPASQITQKAGGGPGLVWVNSSSKVYHCPGDEWYGKTKEGSYMTAAQADAAGNRAAGGKACK
jgi:hypothetical protein